MDSRNASELAARGYNGTQSAFADFKGNGVARRIEEQGKNSLCSSLSMLDPAASRTGCGESLCIHRTTREGHPEGAAAPNLRPRRDSGGD
jgi:hypothetical protein